MNEHRNIDKTFSHWINTSDSDFKTMVHLFDAKDFHWALFMGHIVLEKLLKAVVVKVTLKHAPFAHDLT